MKSLLTLHLLCLASEARHCSIGIDRDVSYLTARWEEEGDSFLTIILPSFAKALEKGLEQGYWPEHDPLGFKRAGGLPSFMRGFLLRVFRKDGVLLNDPDADCIRAVRQVCYLSHKIERECSAERTERAFAQFVQTDRELLGLPGRIDPDRLQRFRSVALKLFGDLFAHCDAVIARYELVPKHGPGAVAERLTPLEKRSFEYWTERLETVFPFWRYTRNCGYASPNMPVPIDAEIPVRVISVPKTQATPRIIAIEPSSIQYAQQGLKREIYQFVEKSPLGKVLGFADQLRNQEMAQKASLSLELGTLDLSEASDRVHWWLVYQMVRSFPHLWEFLHATRSRWAAVPNEGTIPLQKWASMGSAVTFPLEAIVFTTLAVCGMSSGQKRIPSARQLAGRLSIYGDDIIAPVESIDAVVDWLEHFGAKVNRTKSFWKGSFRESCGAEYYRGTDVSVVRLRQDLPRSQRDAAEVAALVDFRNRAYRAGLWGLVGPIDEELESLINLPVASVSQEDLELDRQQAFIARDTFVTHHPIKWRINHHLQRKERKVPVLRPHGISFRVDGEPGLLEWFHSSLRQGDFVSRFDSQERPTSFSIKSRWVALD